MRVLLVTLIAMTGLAAAGEVPEVRVSARLEPAETPFHRPARYQIEAEAPAELALSFPDLPAEFPGLDVTADPVKTEPLGNGRQRWVRAFKLDPIEVKTYVLPALEVTWEGGAAALPPLAFRVRELTEEEAAQAGKFIDIAGPEAAMRGRDSAWWFAGGLAALLAAAAAVAAYLRWRGKRDAYAPPPPPAWEVAKQRLRELRRRNLPQKGRYEAYYVDLTAILRYYIEDRFHLRAPEQTTPEFLEGARESGLLAGVQEAFLAEFLRHCDRVKFAQYRPTSEEMERGMEQVEDFVRETIPAAGTETSESSTQSRTEETHQEEERRAPEEEQQEPADTAACDEEEAP